MHLTVVPAPRVTLAFELCWYNTQNETGRRTPKSIPLVESHGTIWISPNTTAETEPGLTHVAPSRFSSPSPPLPQLHRTMSAYPQQIQSKCPKRHAIWSWNCDTRSYVSMTPSFLRIGILTRYPYRRESGIAKDARIQAIDSSVDVLKIVQDTISNILGTRIAGLRKERNSIASPTSILPVEVILQIIIRSLDEVEPDSHAVRLEVLRSVCSMWAVCLLASKELWAKIHIPWSSSQKAVRRTKQLLQRSGDALLDLDIRGL